MKGDQKKLKESTLASIATKMHQELIQMTTAMDFLRVSTNLYKTISTLNILLREIYSEKIFSNRKASQLIRDTLNRQKVEMERIKDDISSYSEEVKDHKKLYDESRQRYTDIDLGRIQP